MTPNLLLCKLIDMVLFRLLFYARILLAPKMRVGRPPKCRSHKSLIIPAGEPYGEKTQIYLKSMLNREYENTPSYKLNLRPRGAKGL